MGISSIIVPAIHRDITDFDVVSTKNNVVPSKKCDAFSMTDSSHHKILPASTVSAAVVTETTNGISANFVENSDYSTTAAAEITAGNTYGVNVNTFRQSCTSAPTTGLDPVCIIKESFISAYYGLSVHKWNINYQVYSDSYYEFWRSRWKDKPQKVRCIVPDQMIMKFISVGQ